MIRKSDFDILLPLADIPADATARQVAAIAQERADVRYMVKSMVRLYRWSDSEGAFVRLASSRSSHEKSIDLIRQLRDGDVLVFHASWDYFGNPTPPPNQTKQRTASKPATDGLRVCHPRFGCVAPFPGLAVADLVSR